MRISIFGAMLAALAFSSPAMASNTGAFVGLGVTHDNVASAGDLEGLGVNGIGGTIFAGYDFPVGEDVFLGVDANFDLSSAKAGDSDFGVKAKNSFGSSLRLGVNVNDSTAVYGRVGYQRGRASSTFDGESDSGSLDGLRFGIGLETALGGKASLRLEYNRTRYYLSSETEELFEIDNAGLTNNQAVVAVLFRL